MRCDLSRELISADLDGELADADRIALEAHVAACSSCATYRIDAGRVHRSLRVAPAAPVPDLTDAILERAEVPTRRRVRPSPAAVLALQYGLLVVALTIAALAVPELLASSGTAVHVSRHLGGWDLAFAVGLVLAALQPWRARGLVPMAAALAGVMVITAAIDVAHGSTPSLAEGSHLLELFGLLFLWLLSRTAPGRERGGRSAPTGPRSLVSLPFHRPRIVGDPSGSSPIASGSSAGSSVGSSAGRRRAA